MWQRLPWRLWLITFGLLFMLGCGAYQIRAQGYWLTYQVTSSMPKGWYWVSPPRYPLHRGQIVVFKPPQGTSQFLRSHHWLPQKGIMMKYVIGIPGDWACNNGGQIKVNDQKLGRVWQHVPKKSINLPVYQFCGQIHKRHYLLMNPAATRSYDGRYFGPINKHAVKGIAHPLWTQKTAS